MSDSELEKTYGKMKFGEIPSLESEEFENAFNEFLTEDKDSKQYANLIKKFGRSATFGEIENSDLDDYVIF